MRKADKFLVIRCTAEELAAWRRLAEHRGKVHKRNGKSTSLAALVRDGLHAGLMQVCLCKPGLPKCPRCKEKP